MCLFSSNNGEISVWNDASLHCLVVYIGGFFYYLISTNLGPVCQTKNWLLVPNWHHFTFTGPEVRETNENNTTWREKEAMKP